jgi:hypothetical protein
MRSKAFENSQRNAAAGYPDETDPAIFDSSFLVDRKNESMSTAEALKALVAFKHAQRD